ncbi:hypothetical protein D9757_010759 [Collybiopsis confluens]|uniref:DUF6534 domain-containing protein n=1 Tax=Collybiopsis confluens TaxID=2823264 RepID=A0A8H5H8S0_9AGAR|nr:hypothetical protein D9757_010759 [Collybiopsis confluens]
MTEDIIGKVEVLFNGFSAFAVQSFLTWRIWRLGRNHWIIGIVMALVLAEFVSWTHGIPSNNVLGEAFGFIALARVKTFVELATELKGLSVTVNALAAAGDMLIAGTLTFLFQTSKTGTDTMLNKLTVFAVNTGLLTSLCAIGSLVFILAAPNTFIYISFFFCMGRLYTNSLLATLNARKTIRAAGDKVQSASHALNNHSSFGPFARSFTEPSAPFISSNRRHAQWPTEPDIKMDTFNEGWTQHYSRGQGQGLQTCSKTEALEYECEMATRMSKTSDRSSNDEASTCRRDGNVISILIGHWHKETQYPEQLF